MGRGTECEYIENGEQIFRWVSLGDYYEKH
jgi:hypothetical protein